MDIEILTIEVGSTITKANGFVGDAEGGLRRVGQGFAPTSVEQGDVGIGVDAALKDLSGRSGLDPSRAAVFGNSSAAGGLRMTVHGLTRSMTARAAREAALGAGAIVKMVTAGELDDHQVREIRDIAPNLILLAGGVDDGERGTVLRNAERLAGLGNGTPVLYAGNAALRGPVTDLFQAAGAEVLVADNVFPDVDVLEIAPVRRRIQEAFNRHIVHAPGMARLVERVEGEVLPTPGAVLKAAELFAEVAGDCLVFDVGGATTDVHSVTEGSDGWRSRMVEPEPRSKRTVEGDLGVFVNAANVADLSGEVGARERLADLAAVPTTESQRALTRWLCGQAVAIAARRHAGVVSDLYTPVGRRSVVKGKDLTAVKWIVATGGALTRVEGAAECLRGIRTGAGRHLLPETDAAILVDSMYLFSALGTLAQACPDAVRATLARWVREPPSP